MQQIKSVSIYSLSDPRDNAVRYIGQAVNVERRYYEHCRVGGTNSGLWRWVKELAGLGCLPTLTILESDILPTAAHTREFFWIEQAVFDGAPLLNRCGMKRFRANA